jgi:hypothetical protein
MTSQRATTEGRVGRLAGLKKVSPHVEAIAGQHIRGTEPDGVHEPLAAPRCGASTKWISTGAS